MKNSLIKSTSQSLKHSNTRNAVTSLKVVVFGINNLNFGLRIETVYKVLHQTPVYSSGLNSVGIAHIGDREITVVDLHRRLFQSSMTNQTQQGVYLIVVQNTDGELYGIPVEAAPALMDVPFSTIRALPESYRHADTLGIASSVAVIPQTDGTPLTLFLVDVEQILK